MNLPTLSIGSKQASVPIIQGGMGVGVSLSSLASAVANEGGIGIISAVQIGFKEDDFDKNTNKANIRALKREIRKARELSPNGIIGVNIMVAINNYSEMVLTAVEEGIDLIISGAGFPKELPALVEGTDVKIAPIVSSPKAAAVITKLWMRRYEYLPDLMIVEGPDAGGHLGFSLDELEGDSYPDLEEIIEGVIETIKPFEEKKGKKIPIIAAGGIFDGKDIARFLKLGASGVQMGTRFVATNECDASIEYKNAYINAKKEDIDYILSPVGMPGQAIINPFMKKVALEREKVTKCYNCLTPCNPKTTQYCISQALINSVNGNIDNGLIFIGKQGYRLEKIVSVKSLIEELVAEVKRS
ncbi:NAD(P)H-dependent flavin oxidoreductase [Tissierella creatinophila]|uniref:Probable nitronate monooxygenase n=1 Tax=Tissierella creatinophila DSM 6911 TaxID=1123403 RepID=A0A1U7M467_TISCR|nr:nitronate monooxygenase family protein [Tissierella creatinophila]OLS02075.1 nitronate monooxygenase [Tissierella creatinophila DSM 6911]